MGEDAEDTLPRDAAEARGARRRLGCWVLVALAVLVLGALAALWLSRERIASDVIADALAERGITARYEIESIGTRRAVLRDIIIGDPARPDLVVEQASVTIRHRFGFPHIDAVRLIRPRLYGSWRDGTLSFGELDPLIFTGKDEQPFEFPDLTLSVEDGRALFETDYGPVGLSLTGSGWLRGGFEGELGAVAPALVLDGCAAERASLYGRVAVENARPEFSGPLRLASLICAESDVALADATVRLALGSDQRLSGVEGTAELALGEAQMAEARLARTSGEANFTWRDGGLTARYDLVGTGLVTPQARLGRLSLDGSVRTRRWFERIELDAEARGTNLRFGDALDGALAEAVRSTEGTLLAPILRQVRARLAAQAPGSSVAADLIARVTDGRWSVVVPGARVQGRDGGTLVALSRFQMSGVGEGAPLYSGNLSTGGGLPRIAARMEQRGGRVEVRASMAPYVAGNARLAVPRLTLVQDRGGALRFVGELEASGPLPGGAAQGLELPLSGRWSSAAGLTLWPDCTRLRFRSLRYANLTLDGQRLTLCPPPGRAIVRMRPGAGLSIAAGAPSLRLSGRLGETPIALVTGPIGFALPGALTAQQVNVALGPADTATRFAITDLTARIGEEVGGRFAGTDVLLNAVPLDVREASGEWRYADGRLMLTGGSFRLEDRQAEAPRFNPLIARDATLTLADNVITAEALLREPASEREVTRVDLRHDLATGAGSADLAVEGLLFDRTLQPVALTPLALGIVANVEGVVTGSGRIDWNETALTSTGAFSSDDLDFAAAFGPVEGASGTIRFTDLLGLTTAPDQVLQVRAVNPGIAIEDGTIRLQLRNGEVLALEGATWPFFGGTLTMRPLDINFGAEEVRTYVFEMVGVEAALFVQRMGIDNLLATGTFDGTVPVVFDREGNGSLQGGLLVSRPPGGSISYVGELTYEDLSPMANFAFDALRSLQYRQMRVLMDGSLTGDIVTRVRFDGVRQGEGAATNFITRRLARLPLRFDVNIRAPFLSLISSVRGLYDEEAIRDPRELGLIDSDGEALRLESVNPPPPDDDPLNAENIIGELIQPSDSEEQP